MRAPSRACRRRHRRGRRAAALARLPQRLSPGVQRHRRLPRRRPPRPRSWPGTSRSSTGRCCTPFIGACPCGRRRRRRRCCCPGCCGAPGGCSGDGPTAGAHLLLVAGLCAFTAAPWFASLLMPDALAPALVLAVALLGWGDPRPWERAALLLVAALAAAAHLAHLPLLAALLLVLAVARRWRGLRDGTAALGAALALVVATNAAFHGRAAVSPYGAVFALARLVADGPAARTVEDRCPDAGWHLCRWAGRLPTDSDEFLWSPDGPVWAPRPDGAASPRGPVGLAHGSRGHPARNAGARAVGRAARRCCEHRPATARGAHRRHAGAAAPPGKRRARAHAQLSRRREPALRRLAPVSRGVAGGRGAFPAGRTCPCCWRVRSRCR